MPGTTGRPGLSGEPGVRGPMGPKGEKVSRVGGTLLPGQKEMGLRANEVKDCGVRLRASRGTGIAG